jgi:hypothetical protein
MTFPSNHNPPLIALGFTSRLGYFCLVKSAILSLTKTDIVALGYRDWIRSKKVSEPILISKTGLVNDNGSRFRAP